MFLNAAYKFWPTCGFYQSPLDALTALIDEHDIQPEEIVGVVLAGRPVTTMLQNKPVFTGLALLFGGRGLDLNPEDFLAGIHQ